MFYIYDGSNNEISIPVSEVISRVEQGELVVQRHASIIDELVNPLTARLKIFLAELYRVNVDSLTQVHEVVNHDEIEVFYRKSRAFLDSYIPRKVASLIEKCVSEDFFIHDANVLRFMYPNSSVGTLNGKYKKEHLGKLSLHGPHHDHFQNVPVNAINIWGAIDDVYSNNGMIIYPDCWGKNLPQNGDCVDRKEFLGEPLFISLKRGEVLWFHSHHMHSSRINTSNSTRIVFTNRFTVGRPVYKAQIPQHSYLNISSQSSDFDIKARRTLARIGQKIHSKDIDLAGVGEISHVERSEKALCNSHLTLKAIEESEIVFASKNGIHKIDRFCPHEGVDLANGTLSEGNIVCPFHGLHICVETGKPESGFCRGV